jgi:hypothetical protein
MTYTSNPATNMQPDTGRERFDAEPHLDARIADWKTHYDRKMPAGCDQQGRLDTRGVSTPPAEDVQADTLSEIASHPATMPALLGVFAVCMVVMGYLFALGLQWLVQALR